MPSGDTERGEATLPASRALLFPGPQPPLSHFGLTLLRQVVATGLRYSLYQLGLEPPEKAPVRIVSLRLYLDGSALQAATGGTGSAPWAEEVSAALAIPAGAARSDQLGHRARGACFFHRARLRAFSALRRSPSPPRIRGASPADLWQRFLGQLRVEQPILNDALLGELLASLDRRRRRARGEELAACLGSQALRLRRGQPARLERLGSPDLLESSWKQSPERAAEARATLRDEPVPGGHRLRGRFREVYRESLDRLRVAYLGLADGAVDRGVIGEREDAFFLPFDLGRELDAESAPGWLAPAIVANRREYEGHLEASCPPELVSGPTVALGGRSGSGTTSWGRGPLSPLE